MPEQLKRSSSGPAGERGFTLIEVLVTFIILAIGLLGLAQLMARMHQAEMESYQRAQAVLLLQDMAARIAATGTNASTYITTNQSPAYLGKGDTQPATCTGTGNTYDWCIWSHELKGAAETSSANQSVGAMIDARGCIEQIQAANTTSGSCQPGIYRVSVAWQGLTFTTPSALSCGQNLYSTATSGDALRRALSIKVTIGTPAC